MTYYRIARRDYSDNCGHYPDEDEQQDFYGKLLRSKKLTLNKYKWTNKYISFNKWFRELTDEKIRAYMNVIEMEMDNTYNPKAQKIDKSCLIEKMLYLYYIDHCYYKYVQARNYWHQQKALQPYLIMDIINIVNTFIMKRTFGRFKSGTIIKDAKLLNKLNK